MLTRSACVGAEDAGRAVHAGRQLLGDAQVCQRVHAAAVAARRCRAQGARFSEAKGPKIRRLSKAVMPPMHCHPLMSANCFPKDTYVYMAGKLVTGDALCHPMQYPPHFWSDGLLWWHSC